MGNTVKDLKVRVTGDTDDATSKLKKFGGAAQDTGVSFTELNQALELGQKAVQTLQQAYDATVKVFLDYAATVRDVTTATGIQADEASRLIESSDDAGVSVSVLKLAMKTMLKDGVQPSIESMAKLSDEYLAIQDPAQRAQFAMDKFGRSGLEMIKWLEGGGDAMRDVSAVMDDEMARSAEEARKSIDALQDSTRNIALSIGAQLTPALNEAAKALEFLLTESGKIQTANNAYLKQVALSTVSQKEYTAEVNRLATTAMGAKIGVAYLTESERDQARALETVRLETQRQSDATNAAAARTEELRTAVVNYTGSLAEKLDAERNATATTQMQAQNAREAAVALDTLNTSVAALSAGMAGAVGSEMESYRQKTADITATQIELQGKIDLLNGKSYLTETQKAELAELNVKLGEQKQAVEETAAKHEEATKRILFGYLEQRLAIGGTTQAEQDALMEVAKSWGLVDAASYTAYQKVTKAADDYAASGNKDWLVSDLNKAKDAADKMGTASTKGFGDAQTGLDNVTNDPDWAVAEEKERLLKSGIEEYGTTATATTPVIQEFAAQSATELGNAATAASNLAYEIGSIPDTKTVTITTVHEDVYRTMHEEGAGGMMGGYALGGAVEAGQPVTVGDRPDRRPEVFVPNIAGRIVPPGGNTTSVQHHYHLTINTQQKPDIPANFARLRAQAGAL